MNEELEPQVDQVEDNAPDAADEPEKPLSLRDTIIQAKDKATEDVEPKAEPKDRVRAEDGKFAKDSKEKIVEQPVAPVAEEIKVPDRYPNAVKAKWKELPVEVQRDLAKSAEDFHKELTRHDEERVLARQFKETVAPYIAQIRAEGSDPIKATQALYDTAYRLRNGTPQQKAQLLLETARAYGADMSIFNQQQMQPQVHPMLQQTMQELHSLKAQMEQQEALKKQQEEAGLHQTIDAFKNDPKNVHFETVKAHMASLLQSGLAADLQDAYDQAVYANPQTRASLLTQATQAGQEKRVAEQAAKAAAAKKAGSSIKGSPGMAATRDARIVQPDLRSELRAAFAAQGNA